MLLIARFCLVAGALGKHFLLETDDQPFPIDYTQKESAEETDGQSQGTGKDYMMNSDSSTTQQGTEGCQTRAYKGSDYTGKANTTRSGIGCQPWTSSRPRIDKFGFELDLDRFGYMGAEQSNFCRNPEAATTSTPGVWCYTRDPTRLWDFCSVPKCKTVNHRISWLKECTKRGTCEPGNGHNSFFLLKYCNSLSEERSKDICMYQALRWLRGFCNSKKQGFNKSKKIDCQMSVQKYCDSLEGEQLKFTCEKEIKDHKMIIFKTGWKKGIRKCIDSGRCDKGSEHNPFYALKYCQRLKSEEAKDECMRQVYMWHGHNCDILDEKHKIPCKMNIWRFCHTLKGKESEKCQENIQNYKKETHCESLKEDTAIIECLKKFKK